MTSGSNEPRRGREPVTPRPADPASSPSTQSSPATQPPRRDVRELLEGGQEVRLLHDGVEYRLRVTRQGRLILTK